MTEPRTPRTEALWVRLAADIRAVDGNHDLGAGELAERLVERGWAAAPGAGALRDAARLLLTFYDRTPVGIWMLMSQPKRSTFHTLMSDLRAALAKPEPAGLTTATVRTHDPSKYTLHNHEDGTVWQMTSDGSWVAASPEAAGQPAGLDVDDLERAMRAHILGKNGWPHVRAGSTPGDGPQPIDGCDDLCAEDIAREYERDAAKGDGNG